MAQRKQSFRFRIPWLSVAPESFARRQKDASKSPTQSDTNVPIQRPSRPSVITPEESPPSPTKTQQAIPRNEPQNRSRSRKTEPITPPPSSSVIVERSTSPNLVNSPSLQQPSVSQVHVVSNQPQSLSHYDAMKVPKPSSAEENTHPPASSAANEQEKEKMVNKSEPMSQEPEPAMKMNSPFRGIVKSPETSFQPERMPKQPAGFELQASSIPSSALVFKTEPTSQLHPPSPLASEQTKEVLKANHEETTSHASSSSQEKKEDMAVTVSEPVPQETEPKMKSSPLKIIHKSPQTSSQPKATTSDEERLISTTSKAPLETTRKLIQHEEKGKMMHETKNLGKARDTTSTSQPTQPTKASSSGTKDNNKKKHGVRETVERKIMFATSNSSGKDIGVVRNVSSSSISPQRNVPSREERENEKEKEKAPLQKGIKDDITKFVHKIAASVHPTQPMEDKQFSVITLAGDNRGATMHVGSESAKKEGSIHIHRAYKTDPEESNEVTTDGEGNNTNTDEEDSVEDIGEVGKAYVNSNIQSINNSLMFHGSINERDPGVQVTLPQKPLEAIKPNDKDTNSHKTEFNINRSQKTTYQPMVRRRGVRSLLHEPSDSDPDKPRRHGCKFSYGKDIEDIENL